MKLPLEYLSILCLALSYLTFVQGKGGGGGGGGRGGGGARGIGRGSSAKGLTKSRAAVILGSGAAGYAAYRAHKNLKKDRERGDTDSLDSDSFEQYFEDPADYKLQESTSYYASEGIGMSAWALIALILGVIALGTIGWYCCTVFLPVWEDNRRMRRSSMLGRMKDEVPLQETPSTATPSP